jgi:hypothetical protein
MYLDWYVDPRPDTFGGGYVAVMSEYAAPHFNAPAPESISARVSASADDIAYLYAVLCDALISPRIESVHHLTPYPIGITVEIEYP